MPDNWDFYLCMLEDGPASILVDLAAAIDAPNRSLPRMAYVSVVVLHEDENGFPGDTEFEDLARLEDSLAETATGSGCRYVGRCVNDGRIDYIFYAPLVDGWDEIAASALKEFEHYEWTTGVHDEPDWATYVNFLYPDALGMLDIQNRRMLLRLEKMGDNTEALRPVQHWLEFSSTEGRDAFVREAAEQGFLPEAEYCGDSDVVESVPNRHDPSLRTVGRYAVGEAKIELCLCRNDAPKAMEEVTVNLAEAALRWGGEYIGWACAVQEE